jgi:peptidoglycan/LPS O-acetylase OafA/YrhL
MQKAGPTETTGLGRLLSPPAADGRHYAGIDLLRGLAAISILFWHYQHFWFPPAGQPAALPPLEELPLSAIFWPLYRYGHHAVELFWVISGFVFAAVYAGTRQTAGAFFGARFARLYPLHFLTLVVVAALQIWTFASLGYFQIYLYNDLYHFILNVFFVSDWGFQEGFSFNAPIWSVSIEIFVYILFFIGLPVLFRAGILGPLAAAALFAVLWATGAPGVFWPCAFFFFAGSTVYCLVAAGGGFSGSAFALAVLAVLSAWFVPALAFAGVPALFAAVVLAAGSVDRLGRTVVPRRLKWIGDITYSTYLLHVPTQILLMTSMDLLGVSHAAIAGHVVFLLAFLAGVVGLAWLTFRHFERPAQHWLRRRFGLSRPAGSAPDTIPAP